MLEIRKKNGNQTWEYIECTVMIKIAREAQAGSGKKKLNLNIAVEYIKTKIEKSTLKRFVSVHRHWNRRFSALWRRATTPNQAENVVFWMVRNDDDGNSILLCYGYTDIIYR